MSDTRFDYHASTAVVTGATSGIGLAIAHALAARGVPSLLLVARDEDALARAAGELADGPGRPRVEWVAVDLSAGDAATRVRAVVERLGWSVDLLVNDAGVGADGAFGAEPASNGAADQDALRVVDVNVRAVVALSELFLPGMQARGRGAILNVGSTAAYIAVPYSAVYAASKAFVVSSSEALWYENRRTGVRVVCVVPGVTHTNLGGPGRGEARGGLEEFIHGGPAEVAQTALAVLDANEPTRIVRAANWALQVGLELLPNSLATRLIAAVKAP